jgi:STAS-like domain of unknown function (DUF4325)
MMYRIYDITGEFATDSRSGQVLYELIRPEICAGRSVDLDFAGVNIFASLFFNLGIGQLLREIHPDTLNKLLNFHDLSDDGKLILQRVIDNAKRYYADASYQSAVNAVMDDYAASF